MEWIQRKQWTISQDFAKYRHLGKLPRLRSSNVVCVNKPMSNHQPIIVLESEQITDRYLGNLPS